MPLKRKFVEYQHEKRKILFYQKGQKTENSYTQIIDLS